MTDAAEASAPDSHRVARNVTIMMLGQVLGMPLAMLVNIFMGRRLGPGDYGQYYLLTTFATLAFLFVDWGQSSILPARIAVAALLVLRSMRDAGIGRLSVDTAMTRSLLHAGTSFLILNLVLYLKPSRASETLMLIAGVVLLPRGVIDRALGRCLLQALIAGGAMAACAVANPWCVAVLSLAVYAAVLYAVGGLPPDQLALLRSLGRRHRARPGSVQA